MLMLVKWDEDELIVVVAEAIEWLMGVGVQVLVDSKLMEELASFDRRRPGESRDPAVLSKACAWLWLQ
jgi:hypothetical protein